MQKESYKITAKQRSRKLFRKFIKRNLPNYQNAKILCLPGHEALEIFEVYDKLGIPRENITGLERDFESYKKLKAKKLGIKLFHGELEAFVTSEPSGDFNILSLDFMGHLGTFENDIFALMNSRHVAVDECVVFTNFAGAREQSKTQEYYRDGENSSSLSFYRACEASNFSRFQEDTKNARDDLKEYSSSEQLKKGLKNKAENMSLVLQRTLSYRDSADFIARLAEDAFLSDTEKGAFFNAAHVLQNSLHKSKSVPMGMLVLTALKAAQFLAEKIATESIPFAAREYKTEEHINNIKTGVSISLYQALMYAYAPQRHIESFSSCKYVSSNGMPMLGDMFHLKTKKGFCYLRNLTNRDADTFWKFVRPFFERPHHSVMVDLDIVIRQHPTYFSKAKWEPTARIFLGTENELKDAIVPLSKEESKAVAIRMLKENQPIDLIVAAAGVSKGTIAAWKAHITMGTYNQC